MAEVIWLSRGGAGRGFREIRGYIRPVLQNPISFLQMTNRSFWPRRRIENEPVAYMGLLSVLLKWNRDCFPSN